MYTHTQVKKRFTSARLVKEGQKDVLIKSTFTVTQGNQVAELLGNRACNQKVASLIPSRAKLRCVLGQGTSPYLHRGNVPVLL